MMHMGVCFFFFNPVGHDVRGGGGGGGGKSDKEQTDSQPVCFLRTEGTTEAGYFSWIIIIMDYFDSAFVLLHLLFYLCNNIWA